MNRRLTAMLWGWLLCSPLSWGEIMELSAQQLQNRSSEVVIIDVRTRDEYDSGHLPGAIHVPWDSVTSNPQRLADYRDKTMVAYCASGGRARAALDALNEAGYEHLGHLAGDIPAWREAGLPVE